MPLVCHPAASDSGLISSFSKLKQLEVAPADCLVFEDIVQGIQAGKAAGMQVCAVDDAFSRAQEKEKRNLADYYIHHYNEVMDILLS